MITCFVYLYFTDGEKSNIILCSTILLGILTCGTSVLLWWLYKKCCSSKEKYDVEGTYNMLYTCSYIDVYSFYMNLLVMLYY